VPHHLRDPGIGASFAQEGGEEAKWRVKKTKGRERGNDSEGEEGGSLTSDFRILTSPNNRQKGGKDQEFQRCKTFKCSAESLPGC